MKVKLLHLLENIIYIFRKPLFYVSFLCLLTLIFFHFNFKFEYSDFVNYFNSLLLVSSMIFTIMGIWIALIYPNALHRILNPTVVETADFSAELEDTKRLEGLVASVLRSALVAMLIVLIFLVKPFLVNISFFIHFYHELMIVLASVAVCLSILQLESIFHVAVSNFRFISELHSKREKREADNDV